MQRQQHQVHERAVKDKSARNAEASSSRRVDANIKSQAGNVGIEMQYAGRMSGQLLASADPSLAEEKSRSTLRAVGARLANSTEVAKLRSADLLGVALGTASKVGEVAKADYEGKDRPTAPEGQEWKDHRGDDKIPDHAK